MARRPRPEPARIRDVETALAVIAHEGVDCVTGAVQKVSAQPARPVSCIGGTFVGRRGEAWPMTSDGVPLIPWLQVVCAETGRPWGAFHGKKAVCFFLREDLDGPEASTEEDPDDLVVREYGADDRLVPLVRPKGLARHPFRRVTWSRARDYPALSKYHDLFSPQVYEALRDAKSLAVRNRSGLKIGGWPTPVQRSQDYPGACDLQIDATENFMYQDSGIGYLSRSRGSWYLAFETC